ncbi:MAG: lipase family protein [Gammaproteobacteria bacterium]|nr:lipase family protein [Gammaproteobacteria bacterium]
MFFQHLFKSMNVIFFLMSLCISSNVLASTQSEKNSINFREIKEYANFASAAYLTAAKIREPGQLKNYTLTHYGHIPEIEIAYFLATNNLSKTQIISVRGTSNIENAIIDVAVQLISDKHAGVRLHDGFSQAAQAIYNEIKPRIKADYIISTTGHSLGGAVALILAMYLDVDNYKVGQVTTFGQPKVTNITGANKFQHLNIIRVVTEKDLVPLVPPFDPVDINNIDIYWHTGKEVILMADSTYAILHGMNSMMRATRFTQQPLNEKNLEHHQMTLYLTLLDKKIPSARLVPFKNSFNLFNLFGGDAK